MLALIGVLIVGTLMIVGGSVGADMADGWGHEIARASLISLTIIGWALTCATLVTILILIIQGAFA